MASARTERLNAFARQLGFRTYYEYRNAKARAEGYRNYGEQRKARSTGIGLRGSDYANPRYAHFVEALREQERRQDELSRLRRRAEEESRRFREAADRRFLDNVNRVGKFNPRTLAAPHILKVDQNWALLKNYELQLSQNRAMVKTAPQVLAAKKRMAGHIAESAKPALDFFGTPVAQIYRDAALTANPDYKFGEADARIIKHIQETGKKNILEAAQYTQKDSGRVIDTISSFNKNVTKKGKAGGNITARVSQAEVNQFIRNNGIRSRRYADGQRHTFSHYADLNINAAAQRAANTGIIKASGVAWYEVIDGPNCGWESHDSSDLANGSVRSADECIQYPMAHPNCQRKFVPIPDDVSGGDRATRSGVARKASVAGLAIAGTGAGVAVASLALRSDVRMRTAETVSRAFGAAAQIIANIDNAIKLRNIEAGRVPGVTSIRREQVMDDIASYAHDFAYGQEVPAHIKKLLGVEEVAPLKVVGDNYGMFMEYYNRVQRAQLSADEVSRISQLESFAYEALATFVGPRVGGRYAHFTVPRIGFGENKERGGRLTVRSKRFLRATATKTQRGTVGHLRFNPNGLFRVGLSRDPESGLVRTQFSVIPKGPIRVTGQVNRGRGRKKSIGEIDGADLRFQLRQMAPGTFKRIDNTLYEKVNGDEVWVAAGKVTSVTWEARVMTKIPVSPSVRFRANLRPLGIHSWRDVVKLRPEDFRRLSLDDAKFVSAAANLNLGGADVFDISRVFRLTREDAQTMWHLANKWIETQLTNGSQQLASLRAERRRKRFFVVD